MEKEYKRSCFEYPELDLLALYYNKLSEMNIEAAESGANLQHAKWMCVTAEKFYSIRKINRWIGWIQSVMVYEGVYTLDEVKNHSKEAFRKIKQT